MTDSHKHPDAQLRLVIFDVDGTLSDSQADIIGSMTDAFVAEELTVPRPDEILGIVGLSLEVAMPLLAPEVPDETLDRLIAAYKAAYMQRRLDAGAGHSPLYPGMRELVEALSAEPETLLGIATGKSRRGLVALLETYQLSRAFQTIQVADDHPSKPNPSMILAALAETGVAPEHAVMIGDTQFDIDMAKAAGIRTIAVSWGYHPTTKLAHADLLVDDAAALRKAIDTLT
ncbi:HAD-IA family hydrolase [Pseudooceanicola spongiae]|uniref:HAD-IA family hydrolase n=1 Tax=Pseudooceanicola spongiae TaxID=2613965 RepID=A0A7L9WSE3_9RHOB|nr:HAD-IA family hydrolase [Pseudooceanicola spongiae]QOL82873.1 HAD-IA family hydrolase [Pseudooceanicola spongiae]